MDTFSSLSIKVCSTLLGVLSNFSLGKCLIVHNFSFLTFHEELVFGKDLRGMLSAEKIPATHGGELRTKIVAKMSAIVHSIF